MKLVSVFGARLDNHKQLHRFTIRVLFRFSTIFIFQTIFNPALQFSMLKLSCCIWGEMECNRYGCTIIANAIFVMYIFFRFAAQKAREKERGRISDVLWPILFVIVAPSPSSAPCRGRQSPFIFLLSVVRSSSTSFRKRIADADYRRVPL